MTEEVRFVEGRQHPVLRFWNAFGRLLGDRDLPWTVLDEGRLIDKAKQKTGLDDFGADDFRMPFRTLVDALRDEGRLTYVGKVITHAGLVNGLRNRLLRQRVVSDHPEILAQPVKRPLIVIGAPRTGTTLLNRLLSLDPAGRPLLGWEALAPAPGRRSRRRGAVPRARLAALALNEWMFKRVTPELSRMHPYSYKEPDECHWLLFPSFVWVPAIVMPSVRRWLRAQTGEVFDAAYRDYRLGLQILEWQRPAPDHWVLKSPLHLWSLDAAMRGVPEASFIQTHRSMHQVLPSVCSLAAALLSLFTDALEVQRMGEAAMEIASETVARFTYARRTGDPSRVMDVQYADLKADPIGVIRGIYGRFGYDYTVGYERRLQAWLEDQRRSDRPRHSYTLEQFGLSADAVSEAFEAYHVAFGIPQPT